MVVTAKCDGSGNSSKGSSCAAVIFDESGKKLLERSEVLKTGDSNNIAEYSGVILAIKLALELKADELTIFSDSQLIVEQIRDNWKVKKPHLLPLRDKVWDLASLLSSVEINWIPREQNGRADELCRLAFD